MAKKKRTAKQIAATKKLVALNKKRLANKKKTTKKKARRKNPATKARSHLWIVFRCKGPAVWFVNAGTTTRFGLTTDKGKAILFQKKGEATRIANALAKKYPSWGVGVASDDTTARQIEKGCEPPGKN